MDGYSDTVTPREFIKKQLLIQLEDVQIQVGTLNAKQEIASITNSYFQHLYDSGRLLDYSWKIEVPFMHGDDDSVDSIVKGGSRTYYVCFSVKIAGTSQVIHDSVTIYPKGNSRMITSANQIRPNQNPGSMIQPASKSTISSDGYSDSKLPDWSGIMDKPSKTDWSGIE